MTGGSCGLKSCKLRYSMQLEALDVTVRDYIKEIEIKYQTLQTNYEQQISHLKAETIEYQHKYLEIKERYDLLIYKRFGRSAEQLLADEKQPLLFTEEQKGNDVTVAEDKEEVLEVQSHTRRKPGRKPLDPALPREEKIIDISEDEKTCACGAALTRIREETSEKLHIIPPRIYVEKVIRPKYACRCCEGTADEEEPVIHIAPVEPSIIPRSITTPSLLSTIITQKFEDHLPYYRQEKQFDRIGVVISRQDMSAETMFPMAATGIPETVSPV